MGTVETLKAVQFASPSEEPPLCVDLDDTLVKTDTLLESFLLLLKTKPFFVLLLPFWLLKGKANLKQQIAHRVSLDVTSLPYHSALLSYLIEQHRGGREIILATAAESGIAQSVANHLGIFSKILATNGAQNLSGPKKLARIQDHLGSCGFVYAGNARIDMPIWRSSKGAIVVNASDRFVHAVGKIAEVSRVFSDQRSPAQAFLRAIRVHQWVKNGLIFVPLIVGHQLSNPDRLIGSLLAFMAFSLCSSSTYLVNDLLDLEADRRHPRKRHRPFASGDLPIRVGLLTAPVFFFSGLALSLLLPLGFTLTLCAYFVATLGYSLLFKRLVVVDVILLALLYTVRIIAGGMATNIHISNWLLVFSMFLFLSLALVKRYSELQDMVGQAKEADKS
jgi:hypothetical protein